MFHSVVIMCIICLGDDTASDQLLSHIFEVMASFSGCMVVCSDSFVQSSCLLID